VNVPRFGNRWVNVNLPSQMLMGSDNNSDLFPVLSRMEGFNWEGECRYIGKDSVSAPFLLKGGTRCDIDRMHVSSGNVASPTVTLTSFLTFPNGDTRRVKMVGERGSISRASMRLESTDEETGETGPIYMVLTEVSPDTILINEVVKETGHIVMTSSLSLVNGGEEIVHVSHEIGVITGSKGGAADGTKSPMVEGHQILRLKKRVSKIEDDVEDSVDDEDDDSNGAGTSGLRP